MRIERPGPDGEPLPAGVRIIRLAVPPKDFHETGRVSPLTFKLSSKEENESPPRLSVFAEDLTTPPQAAAILGKPAYTLVAHLQVDQVRAVRPNPDPPGTPALDVVWRHINDCRPGASGHSGITGLNNRLSPVRKRFRAKLADIAVVTQLEEWRPPQCALPSA